MSAGKLRFQTVHSTILKTGSSFKLQTKEADAARGHALCGVRVKEVVACSVNQYGLLCLHMVH